MGAIASIKGSNVSKISHTTAQQAFAATCASESGMSWCGGPFGLYSTATPVISQRCSSYTLDPSSLCATLASSQRRRQPFSRRTEMVRRAARQTAHGGLLLLLWVVAHAGHEGPRLVGGAASGALMGLHACMDKRTSLLYRFASRAARFSLEPHVAKSSPRRQLPHAPP